MFAASKTSGAASVNQQNYVTMLLRGDGTNGANNKTFIDSSANNFTMTAGASTGQGALSPYNTLWSNYFSGTNDYITFPDNAALDLSGDFTIECWLFWIPRTGETVPRFLSKGNYQGGVSEWIMYLDQSNGNMGMAWGTGTDAIFIGNTSAFTWTHVAISRSGTTLRGFTNGILTSTLTVSVDFTSLSPVRLAGDESLTANTFWSGYISNVRIVKGTALYTANFTPSTTTLNAVSGTSLLTCQSNRFIDNSSNSFIVTVNGAPRVVTFSPFIGSSSYSAGSLSFAADGASFLTAASNAAFAAGTGAFTWEAWFYPNSFSQDATNGDILFLVNVVNGIQIGRSNTGVGNRWGLATSGVGWRLTTTTLPINGQWNHMAVSRSGTGTNQTALWLNGVRVAVGTNTDNYAQGPLLISNSSTSYDLDGWLSDVRFVKGTAVYNPASATYTIPASPVTAITNTSLLLSGLNAGIFDSVADADLSTISNVQLNTTVKRFGTASIAFTSTGGRVARAYDPMLDVVTQTFTFEAWVYPTTANTVGTRIFSTGGGTVGWNNTTGIHILIQTQNGTSSGGLLNLQISNNTATPISIQTTDVVPINQWTFISVSVVGSTAYLAVNGNVVSGSVSGRARPSTNPTTNLGVIPGEALSALSYLGYMDEVRFTTGLATRTSNYTPPSGPFPS